jgi:hypothetical protein
MIRNATQCRNDKQTNKQTNARYAADQRGRSAKRKDGKTRWEGRGKKRKEEERRGKKRKEEERRGKKRKEGERGGRGAETTTLPPSTKLS